MKKISFAIALGSLLAVAAFAQRPFGVMTANAPDPATMVKNHVDRLTTLLGLSTAQAAQATTIFTNANTVVTPLEGKLQTDWTNMRAAVKGDSSKGTVESISSDIGLLTGQITAAQNNADAQFYRILTPDQQTKLNSLPGGGFGGGRGPGGPGRGRGMGMGAGMGPAGMGGMAPRGRGPNQ